MPSKVCDRWVCSLVVAKGVWSFVQKLKQAHAEAGAGGAVRLRMLQNMLLRAAGWGLAPGAVEVPAPAALAHPSALKSLDLFLISNRCM